MYLFQLFRPFSRSTAEADRRKANESLGLEQPLAWDVFQNN